jgi:glycosyltransferase A (GT-A) superfamily protein (DUF2064 family)
MTALVVIAKECIPGRAKTRLHPPLTLAEAAEIASRCLSATLAAVESVPASRRILYFDGTTAPAEAGAYEVIPQSPGQLDDRLAYIFDQLDEPTILIGMDTPQVCASDFQGAFDEWPSGVDAVFGPAGDGGFWALGMREPDGELIRGVPMSLSNTGALMFGRLESAGSAVMPLRTLRDVDTIDDLRALGHRFEWAAAESQDVLAGGVR